MIDGHFVPSLLLALLEDRNEPIKRFSFPLGRVTIKATVMVEKSFERQAVDLKMWNLTKISWEAAKQAM